METNNFRCHNCKLCLGTGCVDELPGMGGVKKNENFILNCRDWNLLYSEEKYKVPELSSDEILSLLRYAPVTGAVENIGWKSEQDFYYDFFVALNNAGVKISIGDGCPDFKLFYGIDAIKTLNQKSDTKIQVAVFLKPYPDENLKNRITMSLPIASHIGIDIDSYNIVTMRNKVSLEKKSASQIKKIMENLNVPFVVKGVFTREDIEMVKDAKPDVIYISNHGGRVETEKGSTAKLLKEVGHSLKKYCSEIWVDGGIRCKKDIELANYYGATQVLVARPFIKNYCFEKQIKVEDFF